MHRRKHLFKTVGFACAAVMGLVTLAGCTGNIDMSAVVFQDTTVTYDGTAKTIEIKNVPSELTYTYSIKDAEGNDVEANNVINVGEYSFIANFSIVSGYFNKPAPMEAKLTISKGTYDMASFAFNGLEVEYDGQAHIPTVTGLPAGVSSVVTLYDVDGVSKIDSAINVGNYKVVASFSGDESNYNTISDEESFLVIRKGNYDASGIQIGGLAVVYDGQPHEPTVTGLPEGVTANFKYYKDVTNEEVSSAVNAGTYHVVVSFSADKNHNNIASKSVDLVIEKATYDMSNVKFNNLTQKYDAQGHKPTIEGLPQGVSASMKLYRGNSTTALNEATEFGTYKVVASFQGDENHNAIPDKEDTFIIEKASYDMSNFKINGLEVTYDGQAHTPSLAGVPESVTPTIKLLKGGFEVNQAIEAGQYEVKVSFAGNENYVSLNERSATLTINKGAYDMSNFKIEGLEYQYDGAAHKPTLSGVPEGVTATAKLYKANSEEGLSEATEAGTYQVKVSFEGNNNFEAIQERTAVLTIAKGTKTLDVTAMPRIFNKDAANKQVAIEGNLEDAIPVFSYKDAEGNKVDNIEEAPVGEYDVTITFEHNNYVVNNVLGSKLTITDKIVKNISTYDELVAMAAEVQQNFGLFEASTKDLAGDITSWDTYNGGNPEDRWSNKVIYQLVADIDCEGKSWKAPGWDVGHALGVELRDVDGEEKTFVQGTDKEVAFPALDGAAYYGFGYVNLYLDGNGYAIKNMKLDNSTHGLANSDYGVNLGQYPNFVDHTHNFYNDNYRRVGMFISTSFSTFKNIVFDHPVMDVDDTSATVAWCGFINATEGYNNTYEGLTFIEPVMNVRAAKANIGGISGITLVLMFKGGSVRGADASSDRPEEMITNFKDIKFVDANFTVTCTGGRNSLGGLYGESQDANRTFKIDNVDIKGDFTLNNTGSNNNTGDLFGFIDSKYLTKGTYTKDPNGLYVFNINDCDMEITYHLPEGAHLGTYMEGASYHQVELTADTYEANKYYYLPAQSATFTLASGAFNANEIYFAKGENNEKFDTNYFYIKIGSDFAGILNDKVTVTNSNNDDSFDAKAIIEATKFEDLTTEYTGEVQSLKAICPAGVEVTYLDNENINVGEYTIVANFEYKLNGKVVAQFSKAAVLTIGKANKSLDVNASNRYANVNATEKAIGLNGELLGSTAKIEYRDAQGAVVSDINAASVGEYAAVVTFENPNYEILNVLGAKLIVTDKIVKNISTYDELVAMAAETQQNFGLFEADTRDLAGDITSWDSYDGGNAADRWSNKVIYQLINDIDCEGKSWKAAGWDVGHALGVELRDVDGEEKTFVQGTDKEVAFPALDGAAYYGFGYVNLYLDGNGYAIKNMKLDNSTHGLANSDYGDNLGQYPNFVDHTHNFYNDNYRRVGMFISTSFSTFKNIVFDHPIMEVDDTSATVAWCGFINATEGYNNTYEGLKFIEPKMNVKAAKANIGGISGITLVLMFKGGSVRGADAYSDRPEEQIVNFKDIEMVGADFTVECTGGRNSLGGLFGESQDANRIFNIENVDIQGTFTLKNTGTNNNAGDLFGFIDSKYMSKGTYVKDPNPFYVFNIKDCDMAITYKLPQSAHLGTYMEGASYHQVALTADTYEANKYYYLPAQSTTFTLASGAFNANEIYFAKGENNEVYDNFFAYIKIGSDFAGILNDKVTVTNCTSKDVLDLEAIKEATIFVDASIPYDGEAHNLEARLPDGVTVKSYEGNGKTDAGEYTVTANFEYRLNGKLMGEFSKVAVLTITKASKALDVTASNRYANVNDTNRGIGLSGELLGSTAKINYKDGSGNEVADINAVQVGEYQAVVTFEHSNYEILTVLGAKLIVTDKIVKNISTYDELVAMASEVQQNFGLFAADTKDLAGDITSWDAYNGGNVSDRWSNKVVYQLVNDIDCEGKTWKAAGWDVGHALAVELRDVDGEEKTFVQGTDKEVAFPALDGAAYYGFGYVNLYLDGNGYAIKNMKLDNSTHGLANSDYGDNLGQYPNFVDHTHNFYNDNYRRVGMFISTSFSTFKNIVFDHPIMEVDDTSATVAWCGFINATEGYNNTYEGLTFVEPVMNVKAAKANIGGISGITLALMFKGGSVRGADAYSDRPEEQVINFKDVEILDASFTVECTGGRNSLGGLYGEAQDANRIFNIDNVDITGNFTLKNTGTNNNAGDIFGFIDSKYMSKGTYEKDPNPFYVFNIKDCDMAIRYVLPDGAHLGTYMEGAAYHQVELTAETYVADKYYYLPAQSTTFTLASGEFNANEIYFAKGEGIEKYDNFFAYIKIGSDFAGILNDKVKVSNCTTKDFLDIEAIKAASTFESASVSYDGEAHSLVASLPSGVTVSYEGNGKTDVGEYTVTANFTYTSNGKVMSEYSKVAVLTITKANKTLSVSASNRYANVNDATKGIGLDGELSGATAKISYTNAEGSAVADINAASLGEYQTVVTFEHPNYEILNVLGAKLIVTDKIVKNISTYDELVAMANEVQQNFGLFEANTKDLAGDITSWDEYNGGNVEDRWSNKVIYQLVADIDCEGKSWKAPGWDVGHALAVELRDVDGDEKTFVQGTDKEVAFPALDGAAYYGFGYVNLYLDGNGYAIKNMKLDNSTHGLANSDYGDNLGQYPNFVDHTHGFYNDNYRRVGMFISTSFSTFKNIVFDHPVMDVDDTSATVAWCGFINATEGYNNTYEGLTFVEPVMNVKAAKANIGGISGITLVLMFKGGSVRGADAGSDRPDEQIVNFIDVQFVDANFTVECTGGRNSLGGLFGEAQDANRIFNIDNVDITGNFTLKNTGTNNNAGDIFGFIDSKYLTKGTYTKDPNALYIFNISNCDMDIDYDVPENANYGTHLESITYHEIKLTADTYEADKYYYLPAQSSTFTLASGEFNANEIYFARTEEAEVFDTNFFYIKIGADFAGILNDKVTVISSACRCGADLSALSAATAFEDNSFTYDGEGHNLEVSSLPSRVKVVSYENNNMVEVGEYNVVANLAFYVGNKAVAFFSKAAVLTIEPIRVSPKALLSFSDQTIKYDGTYHELKAENISDFVEVSYKTNVRKEIGTQTAYAYIEVQLDSHYELESNLVSAKLTIEPYLYNIDEDDNSLIAVATEDKIELTVRCLGTSGTADVVYFHSYEYFVIDEDAGVSTNRTDGNVIDGVSYNCGTNQKIVFDRYLEDGFDLVYCKFSLRTKILDNYELLQNAVYCVDIFSKNGYSYNLNTSIKGVDYPAVSVGAGPEDSHNLNANYCTYNILLKDMIYPNEYEDENGITQPCVNLIDINNAIPYVVNGKTYYMRKSYFENYFDPTVAKCKEYNVKLIGIFYNWNETDQALNPYYVTYPDARDTGSMVQFALNSSNSYGEGYIIACIDFIMNRYSNNNHNIFKDIIVGNEIDIAKAYYPIQTYQGQSTYSTRKFAAEYVRTLRIINNCIRKYIPDGNAYVSFSRFMNEDNGSDPNFVYTIHNLLIDINRNSKNEGDFYWGVVVHPYDFSGPCDVVYSATSKATFYGSSESRGICYTNIEIVDAFLKQQSFKFDDKILRKLILDECGINNTFIGTNKRDKVKASMAFVYYRCACLDSVYALCLSDFGTYSMFEEARELWRNIDSENSFLVSNDLYKCLQIFDRNASVVYDANSLNMSSWEDFMYVWIGVEEQPNWHELWNIYKIIH